ncbi:MAG: hypothetical protein ACKVZJ_11245 [Phycisphaerales bacterium]
MIRAYAIAVLAVICAFTGCKPSCQDAASDDVRLPTLREQPGVTPNTPPGIRVGYLANHAMQHPSNYAREDYLDLYDEMGNRVNQIVIVFREGVAPPQDRTKPIEVKGHVGRIELGGPEGTKHEYANDVVFVESWRVLDPKDIPRKQKDIEPEPDGGG